MKPQAENHNARVVATVRLNFAETVAIAKSEWRINDDAAEAGVGLEVWEILAAWEVLPAWKVSAAYHLYKMAHPPLKPPRRMPFPSPHRYSYNVDVQHSAVYTRLEFREQVYCHSPLLADPTRGHSSHHGADRVF